MAKYVSKHAKKRSSQKISKPVATGLAVVTALLAIFGGTFAWQSISQEALNEVSATVNPGGRLHDDFTIIKDENGDPELTELGTLQYDKDVYVENFTDLAGNGVQIYARVRLDEYMEFGEGAGKTDNGEASEDNKAKSLVDGAVIWDKSTWTPHVWNQDDVFHEYWDWTFAEAANDNTDGITYMPTFNKNKDSLEADINGTFEKDFSDYVDYAEEGNAEKYAWAIYDNDNDEDDQVANGGHDVNDIINGTVDLHESYESYVDVKDETHTAKKTLGSYVISMETYIEWLNNGDPKDDTGDFWVYDEDGWAYWANPIDPATATGRLLDGIERTDTIINQDWYYGINVVAQFITCDDLGKDDQSGFYTDGAPSENALLLLNAIGVDVTFEIGSEDGSVKNEAAVAALKTALAHGGIVSLKQNVEISEQLEVSADTVLDLGTHTITPDEEVVIWNDANDIKNWSLISVKGEGTTLTIEDGNFVAKDGDSYAVDVRDGARLVINGGTFNGNISAVYVHEGEAIINGGEFYIQQLGNPGVEYKYVLNCYDENYMNGTANIKVYGGTFMGMDPSTGLELDGSGYVPKGYFAKEGKDSAGNTIYTVSKNGTESAESEAEAEAAEVLILE